MDSKYIPGIAVVRLKLLKPLRAWNGANQYQGAKGDTIDASPRDAEILLRLKLVELAD